ncbi:hypothetical protein INS49_010812 [Diaporthe citri]|uniref:uncharacterized protein n=1 Tax=Diaporthe citri TaxID=83186 RepID=UPI001C813D8D|nr:uncharacterized protein INS49_010812 [Diaporthe citri]KAG6359760.1 hypothetical protein INS49_010812 [Diaporthe citri]
MTFHHLLSSAFTMPSTKSAALTALAGIAFGAPSNITTHSIDLKPVYTNGTVSVEHLSVAGNFDGFKMSTPAARGSTDFWYFDVFSSASNQTLNIVFFNSGELSQYPHPLSVQVSGVYANGTTFYFEVLADSGVSITNGPAGVTGEWKGVGSFKGSALDEPDMDIYGTIVFKSIAPTHYPCELNGAAGANQNLLPGLYWANAVPGANTAVDLQVGDTTVSFADGVGYHDKNWGNQSIVDGPRYWDWGRGRLGPCSVVWYNLLDYDGNESRRSFKGGEAAWPPTTGLLGTEGISVNYTLADGRVFAVDVTTELIVRDESGAY